MAVSARQESTLYVLGAMLKPVLSGLWLVAETSQINQFVKYVCVCVCLSARMCVCVFMFDFHGWEIAVILRNFRKTKLSKSKFLFFSFFNSISTCIQFAPRRLSLCDIRKYCFPAFYGTSDRQAAIFFCTRMIQTWSSFSLVDPCSIFFLFFSKSKIFHSHSWILAVICFSIIALVSECMCMKLCMCTCMHMTVLSEGYIYIYIYIYIYTYRYRYIYIYTHMSVLWCVCVCVLLCVGRGCVLSVH